MNTIYSLDGSVIPTEMCKDKGSQEKHMCRVKLPLRQVIPSNTISNSSVVLEQNIPKDYIIQPLRDSKVLLRSIILGRGYMF